eukprot:7085444-Prorocentrum_lima.AAC.1
MSRIQGVRRKLGSGSDACAGRHTAHGRRPARRCVEDGVEKAPSLTLCRGSFDAPSGIAAGG